jgi:hypothetical protein
MHVGRLFVVLRDAMQPRINDRISGNPDIRIGSS